MFQIDKIEKDIKVVRNDQLSVDQALGMSPDKIVISPGPCTPLEAGISVELIQSANVPILGVCLGHQSIGAAFGGNIIKANELYHGKKSNIKHSGDSIFSGINNLHSVVRYHSLIVEKDTLPKELKIIATLDDDADVIMAIEHESKPIYGVQFHPESIDTEHGMRLIQNFISI